MVLELRGARDEEDMMFVWVFAMGEECTSESADV